MKPKFGYLLPTREQTMLGQPETGPLLTLAEHAEALGFDSVWAGDSLLARPRHEPLALLTAIAARTRRVELGTAVLLSALRNPVLLAHQLATLDRLSEGRFILGVGFARDIPSIRAEFAAAGVPFEQRVGRMLEGLRLCRALWTGQPVDWDGRWHLRAAVLAPTPHRTGGPPIWLGGNGPLSRRRVGRWFDGWFPNSPDAATWAEQWAEIAAIARAHGRAPAALTGAIYLTLSVEADAARAEARLNAFLEQYYNRPAAELRSWQACFAGSETAAADWLAGYAAAGAGHLVLRFVGEHERHLETIAGVQARLGG